MRGLLAQSKLKKETVFSILLRNKLFVTKSIFISVCRKADSDWSNTYCESFQKSIKNLLRSWITEERYIFVSPSCIFAINDPMHNCSAVKETDTLKLSEESRDL